MSADWSLPESWLEEDHHERLIARRLREDAAMYQSEYYEARGNGDVDRASAMHLAMMHAKIRAARIERRSRGLE